jgi:hypothetical protein
LTGLALNEDSAMPIKQQHSKEVSPLVVLQVQPHRLRFPLLSIIFGSLEELVVFQPGFLNTIKKLLSALVLLGLFSTLCAATTTEFQVIKSLEGSWGGIS